MPRKKLAIDPNLQLTESFRLYEFIEGSRRDANPELVKMAYEDLEKRKAFLLPNAYRLAQEAQIIRNFYNKPLIITSGHRPEEWNYSKGREYYSFHQDFMAFDFVIPGISNNQIISFINNTFKKGGRAKYATFIHKDIDSSFRTW